MIRNMQGAYFDWLTWLNARYKMPDIIKVCSEEHIIKQRETIKQYAIGYCDGSELVCRPKVDCVGVMFFKDDTQFWFHLTKKEFNIIFPKTLTNRY